nr:PREDICTED: extracellular glycoprotein lacritin isoform X2 [Rhinolophus sinicus]
MRFMAFLLLAALAGALVCAQDATSEPMEATSAEVSTNPELERTTTAESASPQETDPAGQRISAAIQWVARVLSPRTALNFLSGGDYRTRDA